MKYTPIALIAVGTRQCRVPTSVVYLTNLKSAVYFLKLRNPIKFELHWNSKVESYYHQNFSAIGNFLDL